MRKLLAIPVLAALLLLIGCSNKNYAIPYAYVQSVRDGYCVALPTIQQGGLKPSGDEVVLKCFDQLSDAKAMADDLNTEFTTKKYWGGF